MTEPLLIAQTTEQQLHLLPAMANRHGLITGATGTGKTVTLQKLAESFSNIGVPVFMADVKGDLTGVAKAGTESEKLLARLAKIGVTDWSPQGNPVALWISLANAATRCALRCRTSGHCCWHAC
ncbi:hypothetical protein ERHA55_06300 [Erwinia rhapontici]|nr:hypothetical protein ERHA55_06300 [Erwinia rhapontici]